MGCLFIVNTKLSPVYELVPVLNISISVQKPGNPENLKDKLEGWSGLIGPDFLLPPQ